MAAALMGAFASFGAPAAEMNHGEPPTVFTHVSVAPMDRDVVLADQTVIVEGGTITHIGPSSSIAAPENARVIDGRGKFLIPGLVDLHTHPRSESELYCFLRHGVTRVGALGGELPGWRAHVRERLSEAVLPHVLSSTRPVDGNPPMSRRFYSLDANADAAAALASELRAGAALVKTYSRLSVPALKEVARQAHVLGMPVLGHAPWDSSAHDVLVDGLDVVAHGEELFQYLGSNPSDAAIDEIVGIMRKGNTALIVNIVGYVGMAHHAYELADVLRQPQVELLSASAYQEWLPRNNVYANRKDLDVFRSRLETGLANLKRIARSAGSGGVILLAGTDTPTFCFPGECLLTELDLMSQSGLSNYEALRTATANPAAVLARFQSAPHNFGTIEVGKDADLVLLSANPLESLRALKAVDGVMIGGRWTSISRIELDRDALRAEAIQSHRFVDYYEMLLSQNRIGELAALLRATPASDFPGLSNAVLFRDANALIEKGQFQDAIDLLEAAEPHGAISPGLYNLLGDLKAQLGQIVEARQHYGKALQLMPGNSQFLTGLRKLPREVKGRPASESRHPDAGGRFEKDAQRR